MRVAQNCLSSATETSTSREVEVLHTFPRQSSSLPEARLQLAPHIWGVEASDMFALPAKPRMTICTTMQGMLMQPQCSEVKHCSRDMAFCTYGSVGVTVMVVQTTVASDPLKVQSLSITKNCTSLTPPSIVNRVILWTSKNESINSLINFCMNEILLDNNMVAYLCRRSYRPHKWRTTL